MIMYIAILLCFLSACDGMVQQKGKSRLNIPITYFQTISCSMRYAKCDSFISDELTTVFA